MLRKIACSYLFTYARRRIEKIKETYNSLPKLLGLQERTLLAILSKTRYTEFGKIYDFSSIKSISIYQKRIPIFKYNDIEQWIDKTIEGKLNILWPGRIYDFAITSGTTSGNKYIPISRELMATNRVAALDCLAFYLNSGGEHSLFNGSFLFLGGSTSLRHLKSGSYVGDLSGISSRHIPFIVSSIYEPGVHIALLSDWEEKIVKIVEKEVEMDIRGISGIPSWLLVFFNKLLEEASKKRGRNIDTVAEVWPNLSLLIHGGINFTPYKSIFNEIIGKEIYYLETYPASEAFIAIQDIKDKNGLLLMLDYNIFYEFIPIEEIKKENPSRLTIVDVELDKNYAIVLTNNSGLYSYLLGDTVKFVNLNPPRLVVTGRIENFLSAFGEHLIAEDVEDAMTYACSRTNSKIENFTVAPYFPENPRELPCHQWLIEFIENPDNLEEFAHYLDERLRKRNDDYNTHRGRDISIGKPRIVDLKKGSFYNWMKSIGKLGGQHKVPRLKNDRTIADRLLAENLSTQG
jgi:hypothetical protein